MPTLSPADAVRRLEPHHEAIRASVTQGLRNFHEFIARDPEKAGTFTSSTRSAMIQNLIVAEAQQQLPFEFIKSNKVPLFQREDVVIRFKKTGHDGLPQNIHTGHTDTLCNDGVQLTIFEGTYQPTYLTIGYTIAPDFSVVSAIEVICMAGMKGVDWAYRITNPNEGIPIQGTIPEVAPPVPNPVAIPKTKVSARKPKPKQA